MLLPSPIAPVKFNALVELFVHVWLPPNASVVVKFVTPAPAAIVNPLPSTLPSNANALIVNVFVPVPEPIVEPAVLLVPEPVKFKLLITKF